MLFDSLGVYYGNAHPDCLSHNDTAFGSMKQYWKEASNNHFDMQPYITHPNETNYRLKTGIVNNYDIVDNRYIIKNLMLSKNKYGSNNENSYFRGYDDTTNLIDKGQEIVDEADVLVAQNYPSFNIADFRAKGGIIIYVFSGSSLAFKGIGYTDKVLVRGMYRQVTNMSDAKMDGFAITAHEFAHLEFGWSHVTAARYCIMNSYDRHHKDCPQLPNPIFRMREGWLTPIEIRGSQTVTDLQPIETTNQCGVITVYGKPSAKPDWMSGESYFVENRKLIGFDRKITANKPYGFNGGLLIWHYTPYNFFAEPTGCGGGFDKSIEFESADGVPFICGSYGEANHFFANFAEGYHKLDSNRTYSSFNLKTGIIIDSIEQNNYYDINSSIRFKLRYTIAEPPIYNYVMYSDGTSNQTYNLSGNVYVHETNPENKYIFNEGCSIDSPIGLIVPSIKLLGTEFNHITIKGAGYNNYRTKVAFSIPALSNPFLSDSIILRYCDLNNLTLSNYISPGDYNRNISIEHFNIIDTAAQLSLIGNQSYSPHLSKFKSNNISKILITSKWYFDLENDFFIPESSKIENDIVCQTNANPTNIIFSPTTQSKILCNGKMNIKSDFFCNRDLTIGNNGELKISYCQTKANPTNIIFAENTGIKCYGKFTAIADSNLNTNKYITFDKSDNGFWNGIICYNNSNSISINGVKIKNALTGIDASYTNPGNLNIINSTFESNKFADIKLDNMNQSDEPGNISDNAFSGTSTQLFNVGMNNVSAMNINNNSFSDVYSKGISLFYCSNPVVTNNNINATTSSMSAPYAGIHCYQSFGFFGCNSPTNFFNGVLLDNSSPYFLNNEIWNNGYGMYLTNNSNPILSPSYSQTQSLYNAGYNKIYNNLYEEIYCNNEESSQISLPYLFKGFNTIYDDVNYGTLININYALNPALDAQSNYWGGTPDNGMFSPEGSVNYSDYLNDPETTNECVPVLANENNDNLSQSALLFGSANINDYSGNYVQASNKYKQYIGTTNNASKKQVILAKLFNTYLKSNLSFGELNTFLVGAANQYTTDTAFYRYATFLSIGSNVEQTLYPQAINEFQSIIDNSQLPNEIYYANIEKLRTISLMLDTLLNTGGGDNPLSYSNGQISNIINNMLTTNYVKSNTSSIIKKSTINDATRTKDNGIKKTTKNDKGESINGNNVSKNDSYKLKQKNIDNIRGLLIPQNINTELLSNKELINLFEKVIEIKLFEQSLMNYTSANRPLNKIKPKYLIRKGNTFNDNLPTSYKLSQNYPNPFNPATKINFALPKQGFVTLKIYDITGREIKTLVNEVKQAGYYTVDFNGSSLASGVYFYMIKSGDFVMTKKMVMVK